MKTVLFMLRKETDFAGDELEVLSPGEKPFSIIPEKLFDENGEILETVNHAMMNFSFPCSTAFPVNSIIRKRIL